MLAADAQTQIGTGLAAVVGSHLDQLANADLIQMLERIALVDLVLVVCAQELGGIITLKPKVIWVRSLVPKLKNSASLAISPAVRAARGISIMVPT